MTESFRLKVTLLKSCAVQLLGWLGEPVLYGKAHANESDSDPSLKRERS